MSNEHVDQVARDLAHKALAAIAAHERECQLMRRAQEQWQQSATRIFTEMKDDFKKAQDILGDQFNGWKSLLIKTLISMLAGCIGVIGFLLWHMLKGLP